MIEPNQALDLYRSSEQLGMVDKLVQMVADRPAPSKTGMVAVVPLVGVIGKGLSSLEKALGGVDLNDFTKAFKAMEADPQVSEIWLYVNSPGGTATGVEEAAELVRNSTKPTATYSDQIMASAGYYIGAAADRVIVAPSAIVGSIGVRLVIEDWSKAYENAGVKIISITSGDLKGGADGSAISDEEMQDAIRYVEELGTTFRADVRKTRSTIADSSMRGQTFSGRTAAKLGLATGLANSLEDALKTSPNSAA